MKTNLIFAVAMLGMIAGCQDTPKGFYCTRDVSVMDWGTGSVEVDPARYCNASKDNCELDPSDIQGKRRHACFVQQEVYCYSHIFGGGIKLADGTNREEICAPTLNECNAWRNSKYSEKSTVCSAKRNIQ